jgi:hypothetical protein
MATTKSKSPHPFDSAPAKVVARIDGTLHPLKKEGTPSPYAYLIFWRGSLGELRGMMNARSAPCGWTMREATRAAIERMLSTLMQHRSNDDPRTLYEKEPILTVIGGRIDLIVGAD